jgi:WD40 repeat protein
MAVSWRREAIRDHPYNLWDLATGQVVGRLPNDVGRVQSLAFSPDGSRLAVARNSPTVLVRDVAALCDKKKMEEIVKVRSPFPEEIDC